jgi:Flp pilus assembly pilin Flp
MRRLLRRRRGAVLVEVGLVLPLLALVLSGMVAVGLVQLGRAPAPRAADYAASATASAVAAGEDVSAAVASVWTGVRAILARPEGAWRGSVAVFVRGPSGWSEAFRAEAGELSAGPPRWSVSGGVLSGPAPFDLPVGSRLSVAEIWVAGQETPFGSLGIFWSGQALAR